MINYRKNTLVRSVAKALEIVDLLASKKKPMQLKEIADELEMPKSTVYGLISTMHDFDYIYQSPIDGCYQLGVKFFELGSIVALNWDFKKIAAPFIKKLANDLGETVHLAMLDKGEVLYIDKIEGNNSIRIVSEIGTHLPAHCTGVGKVMLAYLEPFEVDKIIKSRGLTSYTKNTITDAELLKKELKRIRKQGYSIDNGEIMVGLRCVAAPIINHENEVFAAISVSGPCFRLSGDKLEASIKRVVATAHDISKELGHVTAKETGESFGS